MKLLLVEDEQLIRKGILMKTDWPQYGINEIKQAENGSDAVRIAEQFQPDILLTDIRMPGMDGIEAARCIRKFCPKMRIIFMSGFSDKEYLKAAISLQAVHYIEKPIHPDELSEAIRSASMMVMNDRRTDMGEEESMPLIKRKIATLLLSPEYQADKLIYQTVQQIGKESGIPAFKQEMAVRTYVERLYASQTLEELQQLVSTGIQSSVM
ncbi:unnamed protein product [Aphanomyces euteiches]